jgi:hypothetical protein
VRTGTNIAPALWLLRLSYLRYALKTAADPRQLLDDESKNLGLDDRFKDLLGRFVPSRPQAPHA